jgi:hypothetical protein
LRRAHYIPVADAPARFDPGKVLRFHGGGLRFFVITSAPCVGEVSSQSVAERCASDDLPIISAVRRPAFVSQAKKEWDARTITLRSSIPRLSVGEFD